MEFVTQAEKEQLEQRVATLVANRAVIANRIAEARAMGDLKENGDYHAAREQQGLEEAEIRRLQDRLNNLSVISSDAKQADGVVFIGMTVKLEDLDDGDTDLFKLVGEGSPTPPMDYVEVTATSPMGDALMKARVGDTICVHAPRGDKKFKILEIMV